MVNPQDEGVEVSGPSPRLPLGWLFLFFGASGLAALIYEIIWFELLEFVVGASAFSLAVLLSTYMGGLFLGSLSLPSWLPRRLPPLRLYAILEAGIGVFGLLVLFLLPLVMKFYIAGLGYGLPLLFLRGLVCAVVLLVPTVLMGGTLPIVSRLVPATPEGLARVGWLYGINTGGAVLGTIGAGFFLLRFYDMTVASFTAAAINFSLALLSFGLSFNPRYRASSLPEQRPVSALVSGLESQDSPEIENESKAKGYAKATFAAKKGEISQPFLQADNGLAGRKESQTSQGLEGSQIFGPRSAKGKESEINFLIPEGNKLNDSLPGRGYEVLIIIGLSGMAALGAEVVWTRLLSLSLGGTVYTFSILLGILLAGLALGSLISSTLVKSQFIPPRVALGLAQVFLAPAIFWAALAATKIVPALAAADPVGPLRVFLLDVLCCLIAVFPAAFFWGASFPLALASVSPAHKDSGRLVGRTYAANTAGAIAGSLFFSLVALPRWGSAGAQRLFVVLHLATGFLALLPYWRKWVFQLAEDRWLKVIRDVGRWFCLKSDHHQPLRSKLVQKANVAILAIIFFLTGWLFSQVIPPTPWQLIAYGRKAVEKKERGRALFTAEGISSSIAVTEWDGTVIFHTSGRAEASNAPPDLRMERMLAHLPGLIHAGPRKVLIVGCGAGITAGAFLLYPEVERVVICEIEPAVIQNVVNYFARENYNLKSDPRVQFVIEDARHFLLTSREKFDVISSDPVHPWLKGSATLYTEEYFRLVKEHLAPGGLFSQWVPLYESDEATVKSMLATFFRAFPSGSIWSNDLLGWDYDFVLLGQERDARIDLDFIQRKYEGKGYELVKQSLKEAGFRSSLELMGTFAGRAADLSGWLERAQINRDRNLRLQYLAGWGLYSREGTSLLSLLWSNFRFPEEFFSGSPENLQALRKAFQVD